MYLLERDPDERHSDRPARRRLVFWRMLKLNFGQLSGTCARRLNGLNEGAKPTLWLLYYDPQNRFALWSFLHMFGAAPDLDVAFENEEDREAARNFMDLLAVSEGDGAS